MIIFLKNLEYKHYLRKNAKIFFKQYIFIQKTMNQFYYLLNLLVLLKVALIMMSFNIYFFNLILLI